MPNHNEIEGFHTAWVINRKAHSEHFSSAFSRRKPTLPTTGSRPGAPWIKGRCSDAARKGHLASSRAPSKLPAKLARREGIDFILDPMWQNLAAAPRLSRPLAFAKSKKVAK
jgi:hypothetical protein